MAFCAGELRSPPLTLPPFSLPAETEKHDKFLPSDICCVVAMELRGDLWVELEALVVPPNKLFTGHHIFPGPHIDLVWVLCEFQNYLTCREHPSIL